MMMAIKTPVEESMFNEEIDALKKSWYSHVLTTLERLGDNMEKLSEELYKQRDEFRKDLYELRDKIRNETADSHSLEILEKHINALLDRVDKRIKDLEEIIRSNTVNEEIKSIQLGIKDLDNKIEHVIRTQFDNFKEKKLDPLTNRLNKVEIKVAIYGVIAGVLASGVVTFVCSLLKFSILK